MSRAGYGATAYPESEWFDRNLARLLEIEDEGYRAAYLDSVELVRGKVATDGLREAYEKAMKGVAA